MTNTFANSFKTAVKSSLKSEKPKGNKKAVKTTEKKSETVVKEVFAAPGGGSTSSSNSGPGGWSVAKNNGYTGSYPPFAKYSKYPGVGVNDTDMMDIGKVEDEKAKMHERPVFPLENTPINLLNAGDAIAPILNDIEIALDKNKSLTTSRKNELQKAKNIVKSILGNIRKAAGIIHGVQNPK